jgi:hypothetical protein
VLSGLTPCVDVEISVECDETLDLLISAGAPSVDGALDIETIVGFNWETVDNGQTLRFRVGDAFPGETTLYIVPSCWDFMNSTWCLADTDYTLTVTLSKPVSIAAQLTSFVSAMSVAGMAGVEFCVEWSEEASVTVAAMEVGYPDVQLFPGRTLADLRTLEARASVPGIWISGDYQSFEHTVSGATYPSLVSGTWSATAFCHPDWCLSDDLNTTVAQIVAQIEVNGPNKSCPDGAALTLSGFCRACSAGTFETDGTCLACPVGSIAASAGLTACTQCEDGTAPNNSLTACVPMDRRCAALPPFGPALRRRARRHRAARLPPHERSRSRPPEDRRHPQPHGVTLPRTLP